MEIAQTHLSGLQECRSDTQVCIRMLLQHFGIEPQNVQTPGDTMLDVYNVLSDAGLSVHGYDGTMAGLRALGVPALLRLQVDGDEHRFVVCFGVEACKFVIGDPRRGIRRYSAPDLARRWTSRELLAIEGLRGEDAERFRRFGAAVIPFGQGRTLVRGQRTGSVRVLSRSETDALLSANAFRTLEGHEAWMSANAARRNGEVANAVSASTLEEWIQDGLLISEDDLRNLVVRLAKTAADGTDTPGRVTSIGIPSRERNAALVRALRGYLTNVRTHDMGTRFVVASTVSIENRAELDLQLGALQTEFDAEIVHLDDDWKGRLAADIAAETDCDHVLTRFALFGDERHRTNFGANRNALLLATAGELCIHVDDDTLLPGFAVPALKPGISFSSRFDPNEYWFDGPVWSSARANDLNFVRLHADMLGRHPGAILSEYPASDVLVDEMEAPLLDAMKRPDARIGVTFLGHDGDVGTATNSWRLFLEGDSLARLVRPGYAERIRRRESGRTVPRRTISDGHFCTAMNLGLDNRDILPPFMPVGRNEDGVFSAALAACLPTWLRGFREGFVIRHCPVEERRPFDAPIRFEGLRANDMIALLIREKGTLRPFGLANELRWLGQDLAEFGSLDQTEFDRCIRSFVQRHLGLGVGDVERARAAYGPTCPELRSDLSTYLHSMEAFAVRHDCDVPIDLDGSCSERRTIFRALVRSYGELLSHWPDIVQCARYVHVHRKGNA